MLRPSRWKVDKLLAAAQWWCNGPAHPGLQVQVVINGNTVATLQASIQALLINALTHSMYGMFAYIDPSCSTTPIKDNTGNVECLGWQLW